MERGRSHDIEPEEDTLCFVDFEDAPQDYADRRAWMVEAMLDALSIGGVRFSKTECYTALDTTGEELAWASVEERLNAAGFDTYNSDTRFEVYPGGTAKYEASSAFYRPEDWPTA